MNNSRGLLYPALHKFYSALSSLEKFKKGTNFFDNISFLDNFFSEYRNVTFVLQKSLAKTQFMPTYEELRDQYLVNNFGKWFVEKRNEVIKQQPFDLEKRIVISIYSGQIPLSLPELIFTIDNDVEISTIVESLRTTFMNSGQLEVMFSAEFLFFEYGHSEDLYDNLILGINQMKLFLAEMKKAINEDCKLSDELERKIDKMNFYQVPKDMLFVDDYVFYCKKEYFEKASFFISKFCVRICRSSFAATIVCNNIKSLIGQFLSCRSFKQSCITAWASMNKNYGFVLFISVRFDIQVLCICEKAKHEKKRNKK